MRIKNIFKNHSRKRIIFEVFVASFFVLVGTLFVYNQLKQVDSFWNAQFLWNIAMMVLWAIVSLGYFHQGWLVRVEKHSESVSMVLPTAVFFVQCILFVKGVFYNDWALIGGALLVNSGVVFDIFQIIRARKLA